MSHLDRYRLFLAALERFDGSDVVGRLWTDDVQFRELPNLLVPAGRVRSRAQALEGLGMAPKVLSAQRYEVRRVVEQGDTLAVELGWTGTLKVPLGKTPAGGALKATFAAFVTFREGLICHQSNFDCYEPF
ncbi:MAG: nuclear transport factor 2 family protein [Archangiaceae bacterium]|nr:nuclear transport factor 2 family protein [Archangiaceae bacterium]